MADDVEESSATLMQVAVLLVEVSETVCTGSNQVYTGSNQYVTARISIHWSVHLHEGHQRLRARRRSPDQPLR